MNRKKVIIIGAGIAGIAAAVSLAKNNFIPIVLESRKFAGGRAYSHIESNTGDMIDNGQHLLMGAYTNFLSLLEQLGTTDKVLFTKGIKVPFIERNKKKSVFNTEIFPGKAGMLLGLMNLNSIRFKEKILAIKFVLTIKKTYKNFSGLTVLDLLRNYNQTENIIRCFWEPLCLAAMNAKSKDASAEIFITVIKKAFFSDSKNSILIFPKAGLSELIRPWERIIDKAGGEIYYGSNVDEIIVRNGKIDSVKSKEQTFKADSFIFTVPPNKLKAILNKSYLTDKFNYLDKFNYSPIISIYLWFDKDFINTKINAILGTKIQWIFNKRRIMEVKDFENNHLGHYAITISGAEDLIDQQKEEILVICLTEIRELYPESKKAKLMHSVIVKEKYATVKLEPNVVPLRPMSETIYKNLYLAGDWTDTGLPATIESACASGFIALNKILQMQDK